MHARNHEHAESDPFVLCDRVESLRAKVSPLAAIASLSDRGGRRLVRVFSPERIGRSERQADKIERGSGRVTDPW